MNEMTLVEKKALTIIDGAERAAQITDDDSYHFALQYVVDVKRVVSGWCDLLEKSRSASWKAYQETMALINKVKKPGDRAVKEILEPALNRYELGRDLARLEKVEIADESEAPLVMPIPGCDGIQKRSVCGIEIENLKELVDAVSAGQVPLEYVQANLGVLGHQVKKLGEGFQCPGVKVVKRNIYARSSQ